MQLVLDGSITVAWALADEEGIAGAILDRVRADGARVPSLWWYEVRNALIVNERRRRLTEVDTTAFLRDLSQLRIALDYEPDESRVLTLSRRHRLTVYDAAYLELAQRKVLPLATLDAELARAARRDKVELIDKPAK